MKCICKWYFGIVIIIPQKVEVYDKMGGIARVWFVKKLKAFHLQLTIEDNGFFLKQSKTMMKA
jgi:hypothetical protein